MKVLVIGDFHGRFPKRKFDKIIKKEKIDLVVSLGDYAPFYHRKLWFKHCYHKDLELWEVIGKKKYRELVMIDLKKGEEILKKLNKLSVPVITVLGNIDYPMPDDVSDIKREKKLFWDRKDLFAERLKKYKNIHRFDYSFFRYMGFVFIGARGHTFPGYVRSKGYKKHKAKLEKLFKKFPKERGKKKVIFIVHNPPYNTKLDKIKDKKSPKEVRRKHYGSRLFRSIVNKYQPILCIGGHFHENPVKDKLKKTILLNPGAVCDGRAAIVDVDKKLEIKFIK